MGLFLDDFVYDAVIRPVVEFEDVNSGRQVDKVDSAVAFRQSRATHTVSGQVEDVGCFIGVTFDTQRAVSIGIEEWPVFVFSLSDARAVLYGELDSRGNFVIGIVNEQGAEIVSGFERTGFDAHGSFRGSVSVIEAVKLVHVGVFAFFVDTHPVFRCTRTVLVVDENCFIGGEFRLVGRQRRYVFAYREISSFTRVEVLSQGEVIQEIISFGQIFRQSECAFGVSAEVIP